MQYRRELKFICSDFELEILRHRLSAFLPHDAHQTGASYQIRSLYFDTPDDRCFHENLDGVNFRRKYRMRIYNASDTLIRFEVKEKRNSLTRKTSVPLTRAEADELLCRRPFSRPESGSAAARLIPDELLRRLHPAVIVAYERTAFVYPVGNVRITFDRNISGSAQFCSFFAEALPKIPAMPAGRHILEVKYDELLPDFIFRTLNLGSLTAASFSKYTLCRAVCDCTDTLIL